MVFDLEVTIVAVEVNFLRKEFRPWQGGDFIFAS